jgi:hypothetical protein
MGEMTDNATWLRLSRDSHDDGMAAGVPIDIVPEALQIGKLEQM